LIVWAILTLWVRQRWTTSVLHCGLFALGAAWTVRFWRARTAPRRSWLWLLLGAVAAWGLLQLATGRSEYRFATWVALLGRIAELCAFLLALEALRFSSLRRGWLRFLAIFGFLLSTVAVVQYFTAPGRIFWVFPSGYSEVLGPFLSRNTYAAFVELVLPVALFESLRRGGRKLLWSLAAGAMFAAVIAGASRAGTVLVVFEAVLVAVLVARQRGNHARMVLLRFSGLAGVAAVFALVVGWQPIWERFWQPDPFRCRQELLISTLDMIAERPALGWGLGTWPTVYPAYARFDLGMFANHAHNDWAEWTAEGGVIFAVLLLAVAVWSARQALRLPWGLGVPSVFLHSVVDFPLQHPALAVLAYALLGALAAAGREDSPAPKSNHGRSMPTRRTLRA
jgi:O-antigen ligase